MNALIPLDLRQAESVLAQDEATQAVVISSPDLPDNPLVFVSDAFARQTGFEPGEVIGRNCRFLQGPGTDPRAIEAIRTGLERRIPFRVDILNYRKDGTPFWNRLRIRPQYDLRQNLAYFIGCQNPIPEEDVEPLPVFGA